MNHEELLNTAKQLKTVKQIATAGKGILAADESTNTIKKRFDSIHVKSSEENRRAYRELLLTTENMEQYISGVILFEETLYQKSADGTPFPKLLAKKGIAPGIKVDKGLIDLVNTDGEKTTQGLDGLNERMAEYKKAGATFAKWRAVYDITDHKPSWAAVHTNAESLARYAAICQLHGIVPIVEPEILINGDHSIERSAEVSELVLGQVFEALEIHKVSLEGMILKPSMVISGSTCKTQATPAQVAEWTVKILKRCVPAAVPCINFLSGGQTPEQATLNLDLINKQNNLPWTLSFSYGRALQEDALKAWLGKSKNVSAAQDTVQKRARLNGLASTGQYNPEMEKETVTS